MRASRDTCGREPGCRATAIPSGSGRRRWSGRTSARGSPSTGRRAGSRPRSSAGGTGSSSMETTVPGTSPEGWMSFCDARSRRGGSGTRNGSGRRRWSGPRSARGWPRTGRRRGTPPPITPGESGSNPRAFARRFLKDLDEVAHQHHPWAVRSWRVGVPARSWRGRNGSSQVRQNRFTSPSELAVCAGGGVMGGGYGGGMMGGGYAATAAAWCRDAVTGQVRGPDGRLQLPRRMKSGGSAWTREPGRWHGGWMVMVLIGLAVAGALVVIALWRFAAQPEGAIDERHRRSHWLCARTSSSAAMPTARWTARTTCSVSPTSPSSDPH
jgi:hypothetical protein